MTHNTIAGLAGALLLSTAGFAFAANGTTVVPAGQTHGVKLAQADTGSEEPAASGSSESASEAGSSNAEASSEDNAASGDADTSADAGGSDSSSEQAASEEDASAGEGVAGVMDTANVTNPEPTGTPSADTQAESNEVASFKPVDAPETPGLALDTAEKPIYAFSGDTPDWYAWRGYKKYGANCLQCHGPDGMGSSFAPNLTESIQNIDYYEFAGIIVSGQQNKWSATGNSIMPAWGEDPNVMCSLDAIYVYLRGRTDGTIGRGEPGRPEKTDKSEAAKDYEYSCLGF